MFTFFSFPSFVIMVPQYITNPLVGTLLYNFNLCCVEVMAPNTESLFTLLLMLAAVPNSSPVDEDDN
jgi:hypothetical protein